MSQYSIEKVIPPYFYPDPLSDIWNKTFTLNKNTQYLIYAASGKGKSTFLNMLIGVEQQYSGYIAYSENSLSNLTASKLAYLRSEKWSVVFQDLKLIDHLTVIDNLNLQKGKQHLDDQFLLESLGLSAKANMLVNQLSWGEKQRLAIARSLKKKFEFLFLDEPFSHLDENNKQICWQLIQQSCLDQQAGLVLLGHNDMPELGIEKILAL